MWLPSYKVLKHYVVTLPASLPEEFFDELLDAFGLARK